MCNRFPTLVDPVMHTDSPLPVIPAAVLRLRGLTSISVTVTGRGGGGGEGELNLFCVCLFFFLTSISTGEVFQTLSNDSLHSTLLGAGWGGWGGWG